MLCACAFVFASESECAFDVLLVTVVTMDRLPVSGYAVRAPGYSLRRRRLVKSDEMSESTPRSQPKIQAHHSEPRTGSAYSIKPSCERTRADLDATRVREPI
ncbi:hypothetical protein K474DRAFT_739254 [Panus rudis PR-1116 ss-1]|nr:hypothetical protein K474DRAFT_739254 [Panus rudis PR-1116 ss-1]